MSFDKKVKVMLTEFHSDARQQESQSELESVTLSRMIEETDTSNVIVGLDLFVQLISSPYPQCSREF